MLSIKQYITESMIVESSNLNKISKTKSTTDKVNNIIEKLWNEFTKKWNEPTEHKGIGKNSRDMDLILLTYNRIIDTINGTKFEIDDIGDHDSKKTDKLKNEVLIEFTVLNGRYILQYFQLDEISNLSDYLLTISTISALFSTEFDINFINKNLEKIK